MTQSHTDFIATIADDEEVAVEESSESDDDVGLDYLWFRLFC